MAGLQTMALLELSTSWLLADQRRAQAARVARIKPGQEYKSRRVETALREIADILERSGKYQVP